MVNGGEVQFVIKWNQHIGNNHIAQNIAQDHLKIAESIVAAAADVTHRTRDGNKGYT